MKIRIRSYKLLDEARLAKSNSEAGYDSQHTRSTITELFKAHSGKTSKKPVKSKFTVDINSKTLRTLSATSLDSPVA